MTRSKHNGMGENNVNERIRQEQAKNEMIQVQQKGMM